METSLKLAQAAQKFEGGQKTWGGQNIQF